ncbi:hypothetical protein C8F01DRAFT_34593 [Mycena amicta]|nr:hypothetical protein C8F01DRAFT_34593 [Mycena amicta]
MLTPLNIANNNTGAVPHPPHPLQRTPSSTQIPTAVTRGSPPHSVSPQETPGAAFHSPIDYPAPQATEIPPPPGRAPAAGPVRPSRRSHRSSPPRPLHFGGHQQAQESPTQVQTQTQTPTAYSYQIHSPYAVHPLATGPGMVSVQDLERHRESSLPPSQHPHPQEVVELEAAMTRHPSHSMSRNSPPTHTHTTTRGNARSAARMVRMAPIQTMQGTSTSTGASPGPRVVDSPLWNSSTTNVTTAYGPQSANGPLPPMGSYREPLRSSSTTSTTGSANGSPPGRRRVASLSPPSMGAEAARAAYADVLRRQQALQLEQAQAQAHAEAVAYHQLQQHQHFYQQQQEEQRQLQRYEEERQYHLYQQQAPPAHPQPPQPSPHQQYHHPPQTQEMPLVDSMGQMAMGLDMDAGYPYHAHHPTLTVDTEAAAAAAAAMAGYHHHHHPTSAHVEAADPGSASPTQGVYLEEEGYQVQVQEDYHQHPHQAHSHSYQPQHHPHHHHHHSSPVSPYSLVNYQGYQHQYELETPSTTTPYTETEVQYAADPTSYGMELSPQQQQGEAGMSHMSMSMSMHMPMQLQDHLAGVV